MLNSIGNGLIVLNIIISAFIFFYSFENLKIKNDFVSKKLFTLSLLQTTITITCFFTLVIGFLISDFSLLTVYQNSHSTKPIFYKIAGTWGNHEGSLLLWINILVIFSFLFLIFNKNLKASFILYTLITQNVIIIGFLFFLLINSNPFSLVVPTPIDGLGLNPILQDPALAIHPPLLYIGFVGSSIYFSAAIGSLLSNFKGKVFALSIKPWVQVSWCFQTLGIIVGSIWAYYELGWGGFWFWDPVENASLMPWFVMTALLHSLIVLQKRDALNSWVIILCLLSFTLSVTGTFLVRSGILNSVHTFASDPSRGLYILIFLSFMIFSSLTIFFIKNKKENLNFNGSSKETFILFNNWFMMFYLVTVLIGTTYPIFTEVLGQAKISVGPPFYDIVILPIVVPFLIFMAVAPKIRWINTNLKNLYPLGIMVIPAILIVFILNYKINSLSALSNLILISAIFLIFHSFKDLILSIRKNNKFDFSRIIAHLGFGLLVFFIGINHNLSLEKDFNIQEGERQTFENYVIDFKSLKIENRKNYRAVIGNFNVKNTISSKEETLLPEIRVYNKPETLTYEASIRTKLNHDIYLTMSNINRSEYYNIKFQKKPFMIWIWLSALLISVGGFIRLFKNEN